MTHTERTFSRVILLAWASIAIVCLWVFVSYRLPTQHGPDKVMGEWVVYAIPLAVLFVYSAVVDIYRLFLLARFPFLTASTMVLIAVEVSLYQV